MRACLCDCHAPFGKIRSHFAAKRASVPIACPQAGAALPPPDESRPVGPVLGGKSIWDALPQTCTKYHIRDYGGGGGGFPGGGGGGIVVFDNGWDGALGGWLRELSMI